MIRGLIFFCLIFFVIILSVGLTGTSQRADLTYVNPSGIHTLDPARMSWTQDFRVALNLWEGLTTWDPETLEPIEGAAHLPPSVSADGRSYTFLLRDDARWSNGDPVTAEDFVRGWRRAMEPGTAADYAFLFTDHIVGAAEYVGWRQKAVADLSALRESDSPEESGSLLAKQAAQMDERFTRVGIEAIDAKTLRVELIDPCPYFLDLTSFPVFLPCHRSIERLRETYEGLPITAEGLVVFDPQWTKPDYRKNGYPGLVTNGAYRLAEWNFKQRARLAVNPFYRDASTMTCRTVDMLDFANVSASLMAYEAGDVDFLTDLTVPYDHELYRLAKSGERADFRRCDVSATYFFNFNCGKETVGGRANPFRDARVRRAFTLATDRAKIVENVLARGDRVAHSFVPPGMVAGYEPPDGLPYSPDEARALLREAGYPDGEGLGFIEILCTFNDERVVQALARMWQDALGVDVVIRSQETKTFAHEKAEHSFLVARGNWYADYNDPTTFLDCLRTGNGNNDSAYSNSQYDSLMEQAESITDRERRLEVLAEAEALIMERDCPLLPILHYTQMVAIKPYVLGLHPNSRLWFPFRYVSIDR